MTLRELAELTALVALQGQRLIADGAPASDRSLQPYLSHSRDRVRHWRRILQRSQQLIAESPARSAEQVLALFSEVLVTEMLTRVWTAVLTASDLQSQRIHAEPIARHVLVGVLEMRRCILEELLTGDGLPLGTLLQADQIRRKCDRWTDLLIGELALTQDVSRFAIDPVRAREFRDQSRGSGHGERQVTWALLQAGLARAIPQQTVDAEVTAAHRGVVDAILSSLPDDPRNAAGRLRFPTAWRLRDVRQLAEHPEPLPPAIAARLRPSAPHSAPGAGPVDLLAELLKRLRPTDDDVPQGPAA